MGTGCSGGSINSNMNASIMPGNLDGITLSCAYPDSETTGIEVRDCTLLAEAYNNPEWTALLQAGLRRRRSTPRRRRSTATRTRPAATGTTRSAAPTTGQLRVQTSAEPRDDGPLDHGRQQLPDARSGRL